jgi:hypothetical protein
MRLINEFDPLTLITEIIMKPFRYDYSIYIPRGTLYLQKLALTSPTSCGRSVGIVRSRTQAREFSFLVLYIYIYIYKYNFTMP